MRNLILVIKNIDSNLPWHRRKSTIVGAFLALIFFAVIFLPASAPLTVFQIIIAVLLFAGTLLLATVVNFDDTKPLFMQWFFAIVVVAEILFAIYAYSGADFGRMGHVFFNRQVMDGNWHLFIKGIAVTLQIAFFSILFATLLGVILSVFRFLNNKVISAFIVFYVNILRAIPPIVIIFFIYYALPTLNIRLNAVTTGVLALTLIGSAYISEIFRSGIEAIHHTQIEAARSLGFNFAQTMRLIILPQAFRIITPTLTGRWIGILKDTAYCSLIAVTEVLKTGRIISTRFANPTPLLVTAVIFLLMVLPLTRYVNLLEYRRKKRQ